jgi:hypothetical protein
MPPCPKCGSTKEEHRWDYIVPIADVTCLECGHVWRYRHIKDVPLKDLTDSEWDELIAQEKATSPYETLKDVRRWVELENKEWTRTGGEEDEFQKLDFYMWNNH